MRKSLPLALLAGTVLISSYAGAQSDRFAYAVTGSADQNYNWLNLRKVNLETGEYSNVLLNGNDQSAVVYDATSRKELSTPQSDKMYGTAVNAPFGTNVAAMAYDSRNNRLYYTPMMFDQLRYIDLKTMKVYYVTDRAFSGQSAKSPDQGNIVTRMVIASDGYGYAMTNDGTQLIRFSTGKKLEVTDLGSVVDDQANKGISIHNSCSSYGGDMIADDNGNLYVLSARNHVFKVNIESKVATHLGVISGLPAGFTVNGAAVTERNGILVASAVQATSLFTVDAKTLVATPVESKGSIWNSSDLANGNLLVSGNVVKNNNVATSVMGRNAINEVIGDGKISLYPNPVTNNEFVVRFSQQEAGNYSILVTDVTGRQVVQQQVNVSADGQSQSVRLAGSSAKGIYMVKVVDQNAKTVFNTKVVVQ
jgi:hypothetical protein